MYWDFYQTTIKEYKSSKLYAPGIGQPIVYKSKTVWIFKTWNDPEKIYHNREHLESHIYHG